MAETAPRPLVCSGCGSELTPALLICPSCHRLVHAEALKESAAAAERAKAEGDLAGALSHWRAALVLLPPESRQHAVVTETVQALSREIEKSPAGAKDSSGWKKKAAGLGALGLLLWKFKFIAVFVLTKGKLLLLGLTKMSTLLSMLLSLGVYWSLWGWKFAAGFLAAMYVHEIGHVAALRRYGIAATAPMFVPGLGAFVRMNQYPATVREDARVGLSGPLWGAGATIAFWLGGVWGNWPSFLAIAHFSAWINLFNLMPFGPLDGGRGFRALSRPERWLATAAIGAAWFFTGESILVLVLLAAVFRSLFTEAPAEQDRGALALYVGLIGVLAALALVRPPGVTGLP